MSCLPGLGHFVGSLWCLMLWFLRNVARNSPTCISNIEIAPLEFCGFLDTYEKLGYPNYVRVLVDEAPKANSCVRSSSHDTVHNPRDASNTTPTPQNAKSRIRSRCAQSNTMARSQIPLSPCASTSLDAHANPLTGAWASLSARGPAIPSLGNPAHVRDRRPTCGTGGPRAGRVGVARGKPATNHRTAAPA